MPLWPHGTFSWEYPVITEKSFMDTSSRLVPACSEPNERGRGSTSPGVLAMLGRAQDWAPPFFHLTGCIGGSPNIFMRLLSLCQQLWAPQKHQGLGSTVPAWEIHRVNRPQVSQREMRMRISFWCLGDESTVGVVGQCKNLFLELWSVVRSISGL